MLCSATSYFLPDTEEAFVTQVIITSGNSTCTPYSITSVSTPGMTTEGETTHLSFTNATQTPGHTVVSTSTGLACNPSGCWTVTNCTYLG